jgi:hypothetical protein
LRDHQLEREAAADYAEQRHHQRFDVPETAVLQPQDQAHVECRGAHAKDQRQAEQQLKRDGRTNDLSQVAGNDRKFASDP